MVIILPVIFKTVSLLSKQRVDNNSIFQVIIENWPTQPLLSSINAHHKLASGVVATFFLSFYNGYGI